MAKEKGTPGRISPRPNGQFSVTLHNGETVTVGTGDEARMILEGSRTEAVEEARATGTPRYDVPVAAAAPDGTAAAEAGHGSGTDRATATADAPTADAGATASSDEDPDAFWAQYGITREQGLRTIMGRGAATEGEGHGAGGATTAAAPAPGSDIFEGFDSVTQHGAAADAAAANEVYADGTVDMTTLTRSEVVAELTPDVNATGSDGEDWGEFNAFTAEDLRERFNSARITGVAKGFTGSDSDVNDSM